MLTSPVRTSRRFLLIISSLAAVIMERILIQKVRENDILYNAKSTFYRDTEMRQRTWEKIGKELNLKAEEARCTWDKLRRCFINARNRRRTKETECGIIIHPWKYERDMAFLWPFVERNRRTLDHSKSSTYENHDSGSDTADVSHENGLHSIMENLRASSVDNIKAEVEEVGDLGVSEMYADDMLVASVETSMPTNNKRTYSHDGDGDDMLNNKRKCLMQQQTLFEMDESDLFFMSMSKMTKTLPALQRAKVKLAVSSIVLQALINTHENKDPS